MTPADLYVISGNQGAGKSTVGRLLAQRFPVGAHVDGDEMQHLVVSGHRWPESLADIDDATGQVSGEAGRQLRIRLRHGCLVAASFADAGVTAILTDIICGERYDEMLEHLAGRSFHFVMLRPPIEVLRRRELERGTGANDFESHLEAAIEATPRAGLWLASSTMSPEQIVDEILARRSEAKVSLGSHDHVDTLLGEAERQPFVGWDFSWLRGRLDSFPLPWDYSASVAAHARQSPDLLDLGTGGGEWLAGLPVRPPRTVATEAWPPNIEVAKKRLEPLGVEVVKVEPSRDNTAKPLDGPRPRLPFDDGSFHLVVARHESFEPTEVARILAPGGWFITQQADAGNDDDYRRLMGLDVPPLDPKARWEAWLPDQLAAVGLRVVEYASAPLVQVIRDAGALAWNLKAISWMVPGFSIDRYRERLRQIQAEINLNGPIEVRQRRFWIRAAKPS